ncbi:MAG: hypothetical protein ACRELZ_22790 [Candidatus Rokuibacteriota bacterium]
MSTVWAKVKHEFHEVLPPMIFFLVAFHIVLLERALMAREYGLHPLSMATATVTALIVAKVVLIADLLPIINRFPEKPLVYNVVWKTAIYVGASLLAHYLEHLIPLWWRTGFRAANEHLWGALVWPHFWAVQLLLVVLFFIYCAMRELARVIGRERVRAIFLGAPVSGRV